MHFFSHHNPVYPDYYNSSDKFEEHRFTQKRSRLSNANRKQESSREEYMGSIFHTYSIMEAFPLLHFSFCVLCRIFMTTSKSQCFREQSGKIPLVQSLQFTKQSNKALRNKGLLQVTSQLVADTGADTQCPCPGH